MCIAVAAGVHSALRRMRTSAGVGVKTYAQSANDIPSQRTTPSSLRLQGKIKQETPGQLTTASGVRAGEYRSGFHMYSVPVKDKVVFDTSITRSSA